MASDLTALITMLVPNEAPDPSVVSLLADMFRRAGADPHALAEALGPYGAAATRAAEAVTQEATTAPLSGPPVAVAPLAAAVLQHAIAYGLALARADDDYPRDADDAAEGLEDVDPLMARVLPPEEQEAYELLFSLLVVATDMGQAAHDDREVARLEAIRARLYTRLHDLESHRLPVPVTEADWECPAVRRHYYFK